MGMMHKKFHLNVRKNFFTVQVTKQIAQYFLKSLLTTQTMGQSTPSASLLMIKNWEEGLMNQMDGLPFRGTWTDWRIGTIEVP